MSLQIGDCITDQSFLRSDGSAVTLADFAGKPVLLIFLRHLV